MIKTIWFLQDVVFIWVEAEEFMGMIFEHSDI